MNPGKKAEELFMSLVYKKENANKSTSEICGEIPQEKLKEIIELFRAAMDAGPVGDNCCKSCGHLHNNANYKYNMWMKFLRQCERISKENEDETRM